MKKIVNGELVDLTPQEITAREAESATALSEALEKYIPSYRDEKANVFVYKGIPIKLTDGARADLTALYFSVMVNQSIPNETVMAEWQERGYEALPITAGDLRADGHKFSQHRQKCFSAAKAVKDNIGNYTTAEQIKTAFDAAYNA